MKKLIGLFSTLALLFSLAFSVTAPAQKGSSNSTPKEKAWVGFISDSMCGPKHSMKNGSARECIQKCVKGGSQYVFVKGAHVYDIANQDFGGLEEHAGEKVRFTGTLSTDHKSITVTEITVPQAGKKAG